MVRMKRRILFAAAALAATAANAEDAAPSAAPREVAAGLDDIVVTAQRRSENVQRVPVAITAFGEQQLATRGIRDVSDLQFVVPSVSFGNNAGINQVSIRGVTLGVFTGEVEGPIAVNVDGVFQPHPGTGDQGQLDLERVEVLRGPQGTLYGRNATGGAINFITASPTKSFEAHSHAGYAKFSEVSAGGAVSGPLSSSVAGRLALEYSDRSDGFVENQAEGRDFDISRRLAGRVKLDFELPRDVGLELSGSGLDFSGSQAYLVPKESEYPPFFVALEPRLSGARFPGGKFRTTANGPSYLDRTSWQTAARLTAAIGSAKLTSMTSYQSVDEHVGLDLDATDVNYGAFLRDDTMTVLQEDLNLGGTAGRVDWTAGAFYMRQRYDLTSTIGFPNGTFFGLPPNSNIAYIMNQRLTAYAGYADATVAVTDRFRVIVGGRYSKDDRTAFQTLFGACNEETARVDEKVTGRGVVQYDVAEGQTAYASVSTGYKSGGVVYTTCGATFKPETITSYELGYKSQFASGVTLNLAAFHYRYKDYQLNQERLVDGTLVVDLVNVPTAKISGAEAELAYRVTDAWTIDANAAYLDSGYGELLTVDPQFAGLGPQNIEGNQIAYAVPWSFATGVQYRKAVPAGTVLVRADYYRSGRVYFTEFNNANQLQDPYGVLNASLTWTPPGDRYSIKVWGRNLTNTQYFTTLQYQSAVAINYGRFGAPRQIGVHVRVDF